MAFETGEGAASHALGDIVRGPAAALTAVALVAGRAARASGWAAEAAVAVARQWPPVRRPVLVDAAGADGGSLSLATAAGVPEDEGLSDVVEYGLTLRPVRRRAGSYDVVHAGVYVPDPVTLRDAAAWDRLLAEALADRLTLLVWLPAGGAGTEALVQRLGAAIVLAEPDEADEVVESLPSAYSVLVSLVPQPADGGAIAAGAGAEPLVVAAAADELLGGPGSPVEGGRLSDEEFERIRLPTDRAARDALIADLRQRQREARLAPPAVAGETAGVAAGLAVDEPRVLVPAGESEHAREMRLEAAADDMTLDTLDPGIAEGAGPGWGPAPRRRPGLRRGLGWTLVVVAALSILGGAWRFLSGRLSFGVAPTTPVPLDTSPLPAEAAPVPTREIALPFVVAVEAHTDLATTFRRLDALAGQPGLAFHVAPLEREGTLYYHIMAGPAPDSASALVLRDTLLARRIKTAATPTDVRHAPLAFLVGDYGDRASAEQSVGELRRLDVPSYTVLGDAADGLPLYRVYVGGFETPAEADVTRQLLRAAGVRDSLVTRTGIITP